MYCGMIPRGQSHAHLKHEVGSNKEGSRTRETSPIAVRDHTHPRCTTKYSIKIKNNIVSAADQCWLLFMLTMSIFEWSPGVAWRLDFTIYFRILYSNANVWFTIETVFIYGKRCIYSWGKTLCTNFSTICFIVSVEVILQGDCSLLVHERCFLLLADILAPASLYQNPHYKLW